MSQRQARLWETPRIDAGRGGADRFGAPAPAPGPTDAAGVAVGADDAGFTLTNSSASDLCVLVTLMARASGVDAAAARERLLTVTASGSRNDPLRVADAGDDSAYARLWQNDVETHERAGGTWTATRSGAVVVPLPAGARFRLAQDAAALRLGVVVAAVAAVGTGADGALRAVDRGPAASIGERPDSPR